MAKLAAPWDRVFDKVFFDRYTGAFHPPLPTDSDLDGLESELKTPLPRSYRAFMKRFGPGTIQTWVYLHPITPPKKREDTVSTYTTGNRVDFPEHPQLYPNHEWLSTLVYFARDGGGSQYAWDPASVTDKVYHECSIFHLPRGWEAQPEPAGKSFWKFIDWVDKTVRSFKDGDEDFYWGSAVRFEPSWLRLKKTPRKASVKEWLAWNDGAVEKLAKSIRAKNRTTEFPALAIALEDAGCAHPDLLESCRQGDPEYDGKWALDVLLGDE